MLKKVSKGLDKSLLNYTLKRMTEQKTIKISPDNKISLFDFKIVLDKELDAAVRKIERFYLDAGYKPPDLNTILNKRFGPEKLVKRAYYYMLDTGTLINVGESIVFHKKSVKEAQEKLIHFLKQNKEIRVSQFKDLLGTSRKYGLPLLIYFDTHNVTIRRAEVRILGQKYR
jgi:selenocysteine-specific elongation factor